MKLEVEAKVGEALMQLWMPIVDDFTIDEIDFDDIDDNDDRRRVLEEYPRVDDTQWEIFVGYIMREFGDVASVSYENGYIKIRISDVLDFNIEINRESSETVFADKFNDFCTDEIDGMSKDEVLEYLDELTELQESLPFDFATIAISVPGRSTYLILDCDAFYAATEDIKNGLQKTPKVYKTALTHAPIELQQEAEKRREEERQEEEKQREIDNKIKAKKEAEECKLAEFTAKVEPYIIENGWNGEYRVSMNFGKYVLSLRLTDYDECRYGGDSQSEVVSKVAELVNFAKTYLSLKNTGGIPILHGNQVRTADWKEIKKQ